MRMRQSLADFESAFVESMVEERERSQRVQREAVARSRRRRIERTHRAGRTRFLLLVLVLLSTAVIVTIAMFQTLYYVMG